MPKKIRTLIKTLVKVGFINRGGKGSHRNFKHPSGIKITISGLPGDDAKHYQELAVSEALREVKRETK